MSILGNKVGELRPSQFITTFGPGSIVDLPDYSVIMAGIDKWDSLDVSKSVSIEEPRLRRKLGIQQIKSIPINNNSEFGTLPAYRFPEYHVCPNCRKLGRRNGHDFFEEEGVLYCKNPDNEKGSCPKVKTHPVRFITACKKGHIDDFPWEFYVHKGANFDYKRCKLYIEDKGETGSLKDLVVSCKTCCKERLISEALSNNKILGNCSARRPWLKDREEEGCHEERKMLLRGASNIYFSSLESSIVIPPRADENLSGFIEDKINLEDKELVSNRRVFNTVMKRNPDINRIGLSKAWNIVQQLRKGNDFGNEDLKKPEYIALLTEQYNYEGKDFEIEKVDVPHRFRDVISNLIQVKRLKEVMVLKGFTRIQPSPDVTERLTGELTNEDGVANDHVEMAPLSAEKLGWLPGVETYGEGIFLTIHNDKLNDWEKKHESYGKSVEIAHKNLYKERNSEQAIPQFEGLRYLLLHTLSHALMRELTIHSGYSSSALKERIYSDKDNDMAGILIYTSTIDSEGSLGGLVELGKTDKFESILARALAAAKYCSGDPHCAEHDAETLTDVNGAACHSCMLISETSCENSNRYLDRSLLVETVANYQREFFNE